MGFKHLTFMNGSIVIFILSLLNAMVLQGFPVDVSSTSLDVQARK